MNKQDFLEKIKDGKWFLVGDTYDNYLVKMKPVTIKDIDTFVETLWLSNTDHESMCFSEYDSKCWDIVDGAFKTNGSFSYHFGSTEGEWEESIYTEDFKDLDVEKMKRQILDYARKEFITPEELDKVWKEIESGDIESYEELIVK